MGEDDAERFRQLSALGAGDIAHFNGSLEQHFIGVHDLLKDWGADPTLCRAGLFHAAYGTAGFSPDMVSLERRGDIAELIGPSAEEIVYTYCACDRERVWPQIGHEESVTFHDRFTGQTRTLTQAELVSFCELTCANETEISLNDPGVVERHGMGLGALFEAWESLLSTPATLTARRAFPG